MNREEPLRYPTWAAMESLAARLGLVHERDMQDWPLEVEDPERLSEFCDLYETEDMDDVVRFVLMQLILFSLDEAKRNASVPQEKRVEDLLRRDFLFHLHTVNYWRCPDVEDDPDPDIRNGFPITPMMRRIWKDCFRPEYNRWLVENETL